ncbi:MULTISPECIES: hypothetical protein [Sphingomonas]|jgi:hypothetical protein|uniref:Uncharacterized protein n=1 Tax=Sphingomonas leidyi TaxID=68569 RepID=A0A7X5ZWG6_9SPHN|nr:MULTISPECIES: hypothetical protein [Sphingomonas]MBN8809722.1 hypothetical protein [Sphingomonas sp.]NIJ66116.1 hypothetical protein [Sphingomonas leidyi]OJY50358.1 MAG: hypothetical protein BGP17_18000 [Sphingomonas sp. 67-41]
MSERNHFEDENRALALSALTLVKTLMNALERKGVLDGGEIDAVVEESLVALEYRHQDAATGLARRIVEAIAVMRSGHLPGQPPKGLV